MNPTSHSRPLATTPASLAASRDQPHAALSPRLLAGSGRQGRHALCARRQRGDKRCRAAESRRNVPAVACSGVQTLQREAVLHRRENAHGAAITAAAVLSDASGSWTLLTAALDKTLMFWKYEECETSEGQLEHRQIESDCGPVFSFAQDLGECREHSPAVYCGTAQQTIVGWKPPATSLMKELHMDEQCGWVKALATDGRWLFSCACNTLHQWDLMWTNPRHVGSDKLFSGDILDIATGSGKVFTCGADGTIHSWEISKQGGLDKANSKEEAHEGRVSGMALHRDMLYTVGFDGHLKVWDASNMDLLVDISGAHEGKRIYCVTMGPDGTLYTGGDDKMVRRWTPGTMRQKPPLYGHNGSVRVLTSGTKTALVSGDAEGQLCLWSV